MSTPEAMKVGQEANDVEGGKVQGEAEAVQPLVTSQPSSPTKISAVASASVKNKSLGR